MKKKIKKVKSKKKIKSKPSKKVKFLENTERYPIKACIKGEMFYIQDRKSLEAILDE